MSNPGGSAERFGFIVGTLLGGGLLLSLPLLFIVSLIISARSKSTGWRVVAAISGVLCLVPLGLFTYGVYVGIEKTRAYSAEDQELPPDRRVTSSDALCRLTLPEHWRLLDNVHEEASLQVGNLRREEYLIVLTDLKQDFDGTLEEHVAITTAGILESLERAVLSEPEPLTINGMRAIRHEIHGTMDLMNLVYVQTTVEGEIGFHQILAWTLASKADAARDVLEAAAATFSEVVPSSGGDRT